MNPYILRFTRHCKTSAHQNDVLRELTCEGLDHARQIASQMKDDEIDLAFVTPTNRTRSMAEIILGYHNETVLLNLREMYPDPNDDVNAEIWAMFREVGNKPLSEYCSHKSFHLLETVGEKAAYQIEREVSKIKSDLVLGQIIGHAVLNSAVARAIALGVGDESAVAAIEAIDQAEGSTIELYVFDDSIRVMMLEDHTLEASAAK